MKTKKNLLKGAGYIALFAIALMCFLPACSKKKDSNPKPTNLVNYSGNFVRSSANVTTSASGTTTATFNTDTRVLTYKLTWNGLGSAPVGMHFHDNGPIIVPIEGFPVAVSGTYSGTATLTAQQATDLAAGMIYSQIHTATYPGGEVIATLTRSGTTTNPPPPGGY